MTELFEPTKSQQVAAVIGKTGKFSAISAAKAVSYRVPIHTLARVDAMAEQAGKSRNSMLNLLLEVALDQVGSELSEAVFQEVQSREIVLMRALLDGGTEPLSEQ